MPYDPKFQITPRMVKYLGAIDAAKAIAEELPISLAFEQEFREEASVKMTHYSTKIEGNRLTLKQTKELLAGKEVLAREIDKKEVMNYYDCLEFIQRAAKLPERSLTEQVIKDMHAMIQKGILKGKLRGEYREAQNAIYDSRTRKPVYFPPEAKDVLPLMKSFAGWLNQKNDLHPALKAGIAHYQFVVIHPFMDGNGRTARALATLILYREDYDLKRFYSLEEYYAEDLQGYYKALQLCHGLHYGDVPNPDITPWLEYFIKGVAIVFEGVKQKVQEASKQGVAQQRLEVDRTLIESIGPREKRLLNYFRKAPQLRRKDLCDLFAIKDRTAGDLLKKWLLAGMIQRKGSGFRDAYYVLSEAYRRLIGT
jgi:Fic family protein